MRVAILSDFPLHVLAPLRDHPLVSIRQTNWLPPLAEAWTEPDGIERHWITLCSFLSEPLEFRQWNQNFLVLPTAKTGRASSFFKQDRAALLAAFRRIQPSLTHSWGTEDVYGFSAVTSGLPSIVSIQGLMSHYVLHSRSVWREKFQALLELYVVNRAAKLTCESGWARSVLQRRAPGAAIDVIEYGVELPFFKAPWKPDPGRPAALFAGGLNARKGIQDVLKAFRSPRLAGFELWVAGSGAYAPQLEGIPNIRLLGRLDRAQLIEKMTQAWCFVLPTRADTGPTVVKEARVIGLPVVTTRCGGTRNYIRDGENGFFAAPGDIATLTDRLHRLLSDFEFCQERGRDGWENDRASFRPELTAQKFSQLYRIIAGASS